MAELKPCPFCGGYATLIEHIYYGFQNRYGVVCLDCYAETRQLFHSETAAKDAWNRRAQTEAKEEPLTITGKIYFVDGKVYIEPDKEENDG